MSGTSSGALVGALYAGGHSPAAILEFFRGEANSLDRIQKRIYAQVEQERVALADQGTNKSLGHATWRSFDLHFRTPFS